MINLLGAAVPAVAASTTCGGACNGVPGLWYVAPAAAVLALVMALVFYRRMLSAGEGSERMKEIAGYVREGAMAYLRRQYKVVSLEIGRAHV